MPNPINPNYHVVIAAAGSGTRTGSDIPKQYVEIAGQTILRHTLNNVAQWPDIGSIRVIIDPTHRELYDQATMGLNLPEPIHGGNSRKQSVYNAINQMNDIDDDSIIIIHDAARPFVCQHDVENLCAAMGEHCAATLGFPLSDTLYNVALDDTVARENIWATQTPQAFKFADLKNAHQETVNDESYTDDASLMKTIGVKTHLVEGSKTNMKITTADDLDIARTRLLRDFETRIGQGFDVHAFDTENTDKPLILCGVKIDAKYSLKGHSDADVGLHAITDAILGALGEGDIGTHFPPSDDTYKDMDSAIFLKKAMDILKAQNGIIQNIDLTLICESPKISPHHAAMKERISQITYIDKNRISVKATTTEQLGFTGRREGIAAQAVASIKIPVR